MFGATLSQPYGDGLATQQIIVGATPVAGASFSLAVDPNYTWRLVSCLFTLTTDANAANRYVTVSYLDGAGVVFHADAAGLVVTANTTAQRFVGSCSRGVAEWAASTDILFPLTPLYLLGGMTLKVNVASVQATDQLSLLRFVFDRFVGAESQLPTGQEE